MLVEVVGCLMVNLIRCRSCFGRYNQSVNLMIAPRQAVEMLRTTCSECARLALRNRHSSGRNIARFASTSAQIDATSESLSQDLPLIQQSHPSLADLEALRPKLRPPSASILTDSPDFAVYTKRFDRAVNSLGRAFKRDQILKIARDDLRMQSLTSRTTKSAIIHQIIRDHWRLPDPQQIIAEEKAAVEEHTREPDPTKQESERRHLQWHVVKFSLSVCAPQKYQLLRAKCNCSLAGSANLTFCKTCL